MSEQARIAPDAGIEWTAGAIRRQSNLFESILADGMGRHYFRTALDLDVGYQYRKVIDLLDYYYLPDYEHVQQYLELKHLEDPKFFEQLVPMTYTAGDELLALAQQLGTRTKLSNLSLDSIISDFERYISSALATVPMAYASFPIEQILEEAIRSAIAHVASQSGLERPVDDYFYDPVSFNVSTSDYALLEERDLIGLAADLQGRPGIADEVMRATAISTLPTEARDGLLRHSAEFGWINTDGYLGEPWRPSDLLPRLKRWLKHECGRKLQEIERRHQVGHDQQDAAFAELGATDDLRQLVALAGRYVELRPYRPMVLIKAGYLARPFLIELARRISISYDDLILYRHDEISTLLRRGESPEPSDLSRRRDRRGYVVVDGVAHWFFGADVALIEPSTEDQDFSHVVEITGQVANRGIAVGRARLLVDLLELPDVDDGDVIVASMTMPDMMPAMERASAYVTDEGGITCHAAIVSRELDVPCVIGTQIATRAISNGDLLEVDANRGRVSILARARRESASASETGREGEPAGAAAHLEEGMRAPRSDGDTP